MRLLPLSFLFLVSLASAAGDSDEAALSLADAAPLAAQRAGAWRVFTEASLGRTAQHYGLSSYNTSRLSLDLLYDGILSPGWRLVFADRVDRNFQSAKATGVDSYTVNTFKEGYLSWRPDGAHIIDAGRINARYGVALGYNPTDFFRSGAIRSLVSVDPNSLRENRLGTVMVRAQSLQAGGSITAIYAPRLERTPSSAPFSPDFGATNNRSRWLLSGSRQFSENLNPQFLLFGGAGQSVQAGLNLSALLNRSTVGYVEWSGGSNHALFDDASGTNNGSSFRQRAATGLTYTTSNKVSLTAEYQYNGAGLSKTQWAALGSAAVANYFRYRTEILDLQELPTRTALFFFGTWQDAFITHLDLRAMVRYNAADRSRLNWAEARYHLSHADVSLQLQHNGGSRSSEFGALPQRRVMQALVTYYF
ncbi:MAG: hypothetical protein NVSMB6_03810 [Burkholderiaceae bacterium]